MITVVLDDKNGMPLPWVVENSSSAPDPLLAWSPQPLFTSAQEQVVCVSKGQVTHSTGPLHCLPSSPTLSCGLPSLGMESLLFPSTLTGTAFHIASQS